MIKVNSAGFLKWTALLLGFVPALFFLVFLIGEGITQLLDSKWSVIPILTLMLLTVSGYILAWKRPGNGGIIMMAGGFVMGIYLLVSGGLSEWDVAALYGLPFIIPGYIFFLSAKKKP